MVIPNNSNTIDFDAVKARRHSTQTPLPRERVAPAATLAELRHLLNYRLQTSLELDRVLAQFAELSARLVPFDAMHFDAAEGGFSQTFGSGGGVHSLGYALSHEQGPLGELTFRRNERFLPRELEQLEALLCCLLFPLRNALLYRLALLNSMRDSLTGLGNRFAMDQALRREVEMAHRHAHPLSILMLDIDHFKGVNDRYGHAIGDNVLRTVSLVLSAHLRNIDMVFRFGGEEFLVLLSNTAHVPAALVGERVREAVQHTPYRANTLEIPLSISIGSATLRAGEGVEDLMGRADAALYASKREGRNRVTCAATL